MRLKGDFNGLFGDVLCLSHDDSCKVENDADVVLHAGMKVSVFEIDFEGSERDDLIASGIVEPSPDWLQCNGSKWCLKIDANGVCHESDQK